MFNTQNLLIAIQDYSQRIPLELFAFLGAFVEEIIAPIPSPFVMGLVGSIAQNQGRAFFYLVVLAILGSCGKTVGLYILYLLAGKAGSLVIKKYGKFFGIQYKDIISLERITTKKHTWLIVFFLRAIPVIPTSPVSIVSGIINLPLKTYIISSFVGICIRNFIYIYLGYAGTELTLNLISHITNSESIVEVIVIISVLCIGGYLLYRLLANGARKYLE